MLLIFGTACQLAYILDCIHVWERLQHTCVFIIEMADVMFYNYVILLPNWDASSELVGNVLRPRLINYFYIMLQLSLVYADMI